MRSSTATIRRVRTLAVAALVGVGVTGLAAAPAQAAPPAKTAVIVQLTPGSDAAAEARRAAGNGGGAVSHVYGTVFRGFAGEFTDAALNGLRNNLRVAAIVLDGVATAAVTTQSPTPSWGLDRIDAQARSYNSTYGYTTTGAGVTAYIIDTGVAAAADLDQVVGGADFVSVTGGNGTGDCNGHGTHVAGTVAGNVYGVAKDATVVPVRVLDCSGSGTWSGVIDGIDWAAENHGSGPAVANMSLGGSRNSLVDAAVQELVDDGVVVAVAAGNSSVNACNSSPARVPGAVTVGATDNRDRRASFSNYGTCLDLFAPGVNITSDWLAGSTKTISGTSMATPHVAGVAARLLQSGVATSAVPGALVTGASTGLVGNAGKGSPNKLLYAAPSS